MSSTVKPYPITWETVKGILLTIAILGWIGVAVYGWFGGLWLISTQHELQGMLTCEQLSEFWESHHDGYTRDLILEKCVIGEKP